MLAHGIFLAVQDWRLIRIGGLALRGVAAIGRLVVVRRLIAIGRLFAGCWSLLAGGGLAAGLGLLAGGRLLAGGGLFAIRRLLGSRFLAALLLVLGLSALGRLLAILQRLGLLWCGFTCRRGLVLLVLPRLLALTAALLVVVGGSGLFGRGDLLARLASGFSLLLVVLALLAALVSLLVALLLAALLLRRDLLSSRLLIGRRRFGLLVALFLARLLFVSCGLSALISGRLSLLLLVALLAWLHRLFIGCRLATLIGGRFCLLLLVALLARLKLLLGGRDFPGLTIVHLLLVLPLLARLLLGLGGRGLFGRRRRFALLLLFVLLFPGLFATLLAPTFLALGAFLSGLAFSAGGLRKDERCAVQAAGSDTPLQRVRAQRRGCHKQADCRARQNPWLAFHINFLLLGSHPCPNFRQPQLVPPGIDANQGCLAGLLKAISCFSNVDTGPPVTAALDRNAAEGQIQQNDRAILENEDA
ncbi:hypothetical protein [Mesorhizobium sp. B4-1-3]|uniref:hypothetical protein n=1 Tax=Mesorhizobium sp. B4-1-3 TaxID=2589889 RepID=UPI001FED677D|nr:hypothetical protein [Mesorhizobium sp. B4-1-3]